MTRIKLSDYTKISEGVQADKGMFLEYEMYGMTDKGMIFERVGDKILYHAYHGIKLDMGNWDSIEGSFFRHGDDNFFMHYRNCNDYDFKEVETMSREEIEKAIIVYVYLHHPRLSTRTLMGHEDTGVLSDPNLCSSKVVLNDNKSYKVSKSLDTVKIYCDSELITSFKLDENTYDKALDLSHIKRLIGSRISGNIDDDLFRKYLLLKDEIKQLINFENKAK